MYSKIDYRKYEYNNKNIVSALIVMANALDLYYELTCFLELFE